MRCFLDTDRVDTSSVEKHNKAFDDRQTPTSIVSAPQSINVHVFGTDGQEPLQGRV